MPRTGSRDAERYETLKRQVAAVGLIRRGSLMRRLVVWGKPNCCCQADPPRLHGPYYQWTRKVSGKTVTVRVNKAEAKLLAQWIANGRHLTKIVAQLERISLRLTERQLRELPKP